MDVVCLYFNIHILQFVYVMTLECLYTILIIFFLDVSASCSGSPETLVEKEGKFGISGGQYKDNMRCGWKIRVQRTKVSVVIHQVYMIIIMC